MIRKPKGFASWLAGPSSNWVQHTNECCAAVWRPKGWKCLPGPSNNKRAVNAAV